MKILISGSTGLVGKTLIEALKQRNDEIYRLLYRHPAESPYDIPWDPYLGALKSDKLENLFSVFNKIFDNRNLNK